MRPGRRGLRDAAAVRPTRHSDTLAGPQQPSERTAAHLSTPDAASGQDAPPAEPAAGRHGRLLSFDPSSFGGMDRMPHTVRSDILSPCRHPTSFVKLDTSQFRYG